MCYDSYENNYSEHCKSEANCLSLVWAHVGKKICNGELGLCIVDSVSLLLKFIQNTLSLASKKTTDLLENILHKSADHQISFSLLHFSVSFLLSSF